MLFSSKKVNSGWGYSVGILVANVIFILCATAVFINIEGPAELSEKQEDWKTKVHLMKHVKNSVMPPQTPDSIIRDLLQLQKEMCKKSNSRAGEKSWEYTGSLHYCLTILSTIGYGVAAPHNNLSKTISVVYAMIGIPIYAVYLSYTYLAISSFLDSLTQLVCTCLRKNPSELAKIGMKLFLANAILWLYLVILIFLWTPLHTDQSLKHPKIHKSGYSNKEGKSVIDEMYFQVIRFTSVGFGDEFRDVGKQPKHIPNIVNVFIVGFILLPFGISITSFFFQMYRKIFGNRRKWAGLRFEKIQKKTVSRIQTVRVKKRLSAAGHNDTMSSNVKLGDNQSNNLSCNGNNHHEIIDETCEKDL